MRNSKKVVLYHPSHYLGGSEVLFARVAGLLLDHGYEVHLVDYESDGATYRALGARSSDVFFHGYGTTAFYTVLETGGILIGSAVNILRLYNEVPDSCYSFRVLFWVLHPAELYAQIGIGYDKVKKTFGYEWLRLSYALNPLHSPFEKLVDHLHKSRSLCFMDAAVLAETEWVTKKKIADPKFLRLVTGLQSTDRPVCHSSGPDRYLIISRLDSFKVAGLAKFMADINDYATLSCSGRVVVDIIGGGPSESDLKALAYTYNVTFNFLGHLSLDRIRALISSGAYTCLFAMGMSILEGASVGLPVVLLPASDGPIIDDKCYVIVSSKSDVLGEYFHSPARNLLYQSLPSVCDDIKRDWKLSRQRALEFFDTFYSNDFIHLENAIQGCLPTSRQAWGKNGFLRLARHVYTWRASRLRQKKRSW